jgi:hypothetical protein
MALEIAFIQKFMDAGCGQNICLAALLSISGYAVR